MAKAKTPAAKKAAIVEQASGPVLGSWVEFVGYSGDIAEEDKYLIEGEYYQVISLPEEVESEGETVMTGYGVQLDNPDFNPKKKENDETNPRLLAMDVYDGEFELLSDDEARELGLGEEQEQEEEAPPAKTPAKAKASAKKGKKVPASLFDEPEGEEEEEEEAPPVKAKAATKAKTATKAKAATKSKAPAKEKPAAKAATKAKAPAKAKAAAPAPAKPRAVAVGDDGLPDLDPDQEDVVVRGYLDEQRDLVEVAQSLESQAAQSEYHFGGVLYHIKKSGVYKDLDEAFAGNEGWRTFVFEYFNMDYRKAQYLLDIYVKFTEAGIENPAEVVARIGWTKASKIAKPLSLDGADTDGLIQLAEENSVKDLSKIIKDEVEVPGTGTKGEMVKRLTLKFRYLQEEALIIEGVLEQASQLFNVEPNEALLRICAEWQQENVQTPELKAAMPKAKAKN